MRMQNVIRVKRTRSEFVKYFGLVLQHLHKDQKPFPCFFPHSFLTSPVFPCFHTTSITLKHILVLLSLVDVEKALINMKEFLGAPGS